MAINRAYPRKYIQFSLNHLLCSMFFLAEKKGKLSDFLVVLLLFSFEFISLMKNRNQFDIFVCILYVRWFETQPFMLFPHICAFIMRAGKGSAQLTSINFILQQSYRKKCFKRFKQTKLLFTKKLCTTRITAHTYTYLHTHMHTQPRKSLKRIPICMLLMNVCQGGSF